MFRISVKYNVPLNRLAEFNDMKVNDPIHPGQKIKLP
ncbi:MAG: LysM peptidoglycan-binding domain-containing protein [Desulfobacterales bacterium]|nr:LysM peptidoglycan-binding domain-containing protein [Desulfobacterales bacterium]